MAYNANIREEELKNKVAKDWFKDYDCTKIIGNIDFCVAVPREGKETDETESLLWAEAKYGTRHDIRESFVQLILTIGKARTLDGYLPPVYLGAFDAGRIAFLPYSDIQHIFSLNDFNWNVTPSDHETKEFKTLYDKVRETLARQTLEFRFGEDNRELKSFIRKNLKAGNKRSSGIRINKSNFIHIYQKWTRHVKPYIDVDWESAKEAKISDVDFYLADILSEDNRTIMKNLYVVLDGDKYEVDRKINESRLLQGQTATFTDNGEAHSRFWNRYRRPPKEECWEYIISRRDLLVPQDVRERKGSFFTPQQWVELSQQYLAEELGENWQEEYYIWDCAAGTGNLLNGLSNKYNIWASTLDQADVDVMHERIESNSFNMLSGHVFRFDFLNDSFDKLPQGLQDIINDEEKRKRLVIYINPPYAEAGNVRQRTGKGENKSGTAINHATYMKYKPEIRQAASELFAQFFIRIYKEIPSCVLAEFSTLKILQAHMRGF